MLGAPVRAAVAPEGMADAGAAGGERWSRWWEALRR